jgi:hypothetical protein
VTNAKITAVNKSRGIFATHWEFDFSLGNSEGKVMEGKLSLDEAIGFANRPDVGPVADMCRTIKATPPVGFSLLVGRVFKGEG